MVFGTWPGTRQIVDNDSDNDFDMESVNVVGAVPVVRRGPSMAKANIDDDIDDNSADGSAAGDVEALDATNDSENDSVDSAGSDEEIPEQDASMF